MMAFLASIVGGPECSGSKAAALITIVPRVAGHKYDGYGVRSRGTGMTGTGSRSRAAGGADFDFDVYT